MRDAREVKNELFEAEGAQTSFCIMNESLGTDRSDEMKVKVKTVAKYFQDRIRDLRYELKEIKL